MKSGNPAFGLGFSTAPAMVSGVAIVLAVSGMVVAALSSCTAASPPSPAPTPTTVRTTAPAPAPRPSPTSTAVGEATPKTAHAPAPEVIVYASDLSGSALSDELTFWDSPDSPGGKMIGLPNTGDELDPPPENDPAVTFRVEVLEGVPYRCWIHMKVGTPKGKSQANVFWAQFSGALDEENREILQPGSASYMTAQGPEQEGWVWVACDPQQGYSAPLVQFGRSGPIAVRLQAGMEGVGFDQFLLSPARFLQQAPSEAVVTK